MTPQPVQRQLRRPLLWQVLDVVVAEDLLVVCAHPVVYAQGDLSWQLEPLEVSVLLLHLWLAPALAAAALGLQHASAMG